MRFRLKDNSDDIEDLKLKISLSCHSLGVKNKISFLNSKSIAIQQHSVLIVVHNIQAQLIYLKPTS